MATTQNNASRTECLRWWLKLVIQPLLFLLAGIAIIVGIGIAQRQGWIQSGNATNETTVAAATARYICPMMCTPPQDKPGRCPVCGMDLVPAASQGSEDKLAVQIGAAARRVAGIKTVTVRSDSPIQTIEAVGELAFDESSLKTISAYVDGRLEKLDADYTGVLVEPEQTLGLLYSPDLYTAQVAYLQTKRAITKSSSLARTDQSRNRLHRSARKGLLELGLSETQIADLEQRNSAESRLQITSPIGGTVVEKLAKEGDYVKRGQPIYRVANLTKVWLLLELFPNDAAAIKVGQSVEAVVHSLPSRRFSGTVAFIDPVVDTKKRTVGVRVVLNNEDGLLRIGDYATATISVPITSDANNLANVLLIPRNAVLAAGETSVAYVETETGRFEIRALTLGPTVGDEVVVLNGVGENELVAVEGAFLIDSQMQIAGNPSLIDPTRAETEMVAMDFADMDLPEIGDMEFADDNAPTIELVNDTNSFSPDDIAAIERQGLCPVGNTKLGSMGKPIKVDVSGRSVFICCEACRKRLLDNPEKYLAKLPTEDTR